jgi:hypothetical protein
MSLTDLQHRVRTLIAEDQLPSAIEVLLENIQSGDHYDSLVLLSSKLHAIQKAFFEGRMDYQEEQKQLNQLRTALLRLIGGLKQQDIKRSRAASGPEAVIEYYWQSVARVSVLWILIQDPHLENGLTITELYSFSKLTKRKYIVQVLNELTELSSIEKYKKDQLVYWKLTSSGAELAEELLESTVFKFP